MISVVFGDVSYTLPYGSKGKPRQAPRALLRFFASCRRVEVGSFGAWGGKVGHFASLLGVFVSLGGFWV